MIFSICIFQVPGCPETRSEMVAQMEKQFKMVPSRSKIQEQIDFMYLSIKIVHIV